MKFKKGEAYGNKGDLQGHRGSGAAGDTGTAQGRYDVAGDIASHFDMTQATVSYHLSQLKKAGLIYENREKNFIYYQLNTSVFEEIMLWCRGFMGGKDDEEDK